MKSEVDCPEHYQINTVFSIWLLTHSSSHFREVSGPPLVILQASVAGSPTFTVTSPDFGTGSTSGLTAVEDVFYRGFGVKFILTKYLNGKLKLYWRMLSSGHFTDILASILLFCLSDNNSAPIFCVLNLYSVVIIFI